MKNSKINYQELAISRVVVTLFMYLGLSLLAWLYTLPFSKTYLQINYYYKYIEYAFILLLFVLAFGYLIFTLVKCKKGYTAENKIVTPFMLNIYFLSAFIAALIMPISHNRTLTLKYSVICFAVIVAVYAVYYLVEKCFAYNAVVCSVYCILLGLISEFYSQNVTFSDKINIPYSTFILMIVALVVLTILVTYCVCKKIQSIKLWHTGLLSLIIIAALIVRIFVYKYVSIIAISVLILSFVGIMIYEKIFAK